MSQGHNLIASGLEGCFGADPTDIVGPLDAKLGALRENDGQTLTHALLPGSPAIDAGNPAAPGSGGAACEATDQRSVSRPQGVRCDIGAYEAYPACDVASDGDPCDDGDGCTTGDTCVGGTCKGRSSLDCDDSDPCTNDICDRDLGCQHTQIRGCFGRCGNGVLNPEFGEQCDSGTANGTASSCCQADCTLRPAGEVCRPAAGVCDVPEHCDGLRPSCPLDGFAPQTSLCRRSEGSCDKDDFCTGVQPDCPDQMKRLGMPCGDPGDVCNGVDKHCPFNCGNGTTEPELNEECDDGNRALGDACRPDCTAERCGDGIRDPQEQCDGDLACTLTCRFACQTDVDCDRDSRCTRRLCENGQCGTELSCAGDACTGASGDLASVTCAFERRFGGGFCRSHRDQLVADRVNRSIRKLLLELRGLPELCGRAQAHRKMRRLLGQVDQQLGRLQLLAA